MPTAIAIRSLVTGFFLDLRYIAGKHAYAYGATDTLYNLTLSPSDYFQHKH